MKKIATLYIIAGIVLYLLENGPDIGTRDSQNQTLLRLAAKHGNSGLTQKLLSRGADYDAERLHRFSNGDGWKSLSYAIYCGHDTILPPIELRGSSGCPKQIS